MYNLYEFIWGSWSQEEVRSQYFSISDFSLNGFSNKFGQLVRALHASRHLNCSLPVVVAKALLVHKLCQGFLGNPWIVVDDNILRWRTGSLSHFLGCEVEVERIVDGKLIKDNSSWVRVCHFWCKLTSLLSTIPIDFKYSRVNLLVDSHIKQFRPIVNSFCFLSNHLYNQF